MPLAREAIITLFINIRRSFLSLVSFMEYVLISIYTIALLFLIGKWKLFRFEGIHVRWFQAIFLIKIMAGVALYLLYTRYYTARSDADIFKYFDDSKVLYNAFWEHPLDFLKMFFGIGAESEYFRSNYYDEMNTWFKIYDSQVFNNNRTMIRTNTLFRFFSGGSYHIHSIFMCFLSLTGLTLLMKAFRRTTEKFGVISVILICLLPSTLLWTSGVLKEGIVIIWMGLLAYSGSKLKTKFSIIHTLSVVFALWMIFTTKYYVLLCLIPVGLSLLLGTFWKKFPALRYATTAALVVISGWAVSHFTSMHTDLVTGKHDDMIRHSLAENAGSLFDHHLFLGSDSFGYWDLVLHSPNAIAQCFIQPTPNNLSSPMSLLALVENIFIVLTLMVSVIFLSRKANREMVFGIVLFTLFLYAILGLTTPNAGALVRYKMPALPLLILLVLELTNKEKLTSIFRLKKRNLSQ